ncbi:MAG: flagellar basal body rod protein FlgB [Pseudomonadota bacterium]
MQTDPLAQHGKALALRAERNEVLATNLANADTPGYLARDFDFSAALSGATNQLSTLPIARTDSGHINPDAGAIDTQTALAWRVPTQPSVDGNTVETDVEQAEYAKNVIGYQASLTFLNQKIAGLRLAIRGQL